MQNNSSKQRYNEEAVQVFKGSLGYQPVKKNKYSKSASTKYGPAPKFP